ncbi:MAG: 5-oxoprolinase [Phycisphaeraceae bacterium]|nr:MAG: 5-oxoprolinase [Phycisphaeraceae bacterium]
MTIRASEQFEAARRWRIWVDTGGTFTDCIAVDPDGRERRVKTLSSGVLRAVVEDWVGARALRLRQSWEAPDDFVRGFHLRTLGDDGGVSIRITSFDAAASVIEVEGDASERAFAPGVAVEAVSGEEAPVLAARLVTGTAAGAALPPVDLRLATTRGTNALLERRGAVVALFITRGFADLPLIGDQTRPDLFALDIQRPAPLHAHVVEVSERLDAAGKVLRRLDTDAMREEIDRLLGAGVRDASVTLMHADIEPRHERALRDHLLECGFERVAISSDLSPFVRIVPRLQTATAEAYLGPVVSKHLDCVRAAARAEKTDSRLHVMTSAGGLVGVDSCRASQTLLSGPAGGVAGAAAAGSRSGFERVISFDMGGTSTDVARWGGAFRYVYEHRVGDAHVMAPALAIETVAAGGGSICMWDERQRRLRVGPESAGAAPGPACYGAGGPLTITDVNLLLGRIDAKRMPIPIDVDAATEAAESLRAIVERETGEALTIEALLEGLIDIADEIMAEAIRRISVREGHDPAECALVAFGGAGGLHACGVADRLGIESVVLPKDAGLLSAAGVGAARLERFAERQALRPLDELEGEIAGVVRELEQEATEQVCEEGAAPGEVSITRRIVGMRYKGQESSLSIEFESGHELRKAFEHEHESIFGHTLEDRGVEVESIRVVASVKPDDAADSGGELKPRDASPDGRVRACFGGDWSKIPIFDRAQLAPGDRFDGPAIVFDAHSAAVVGAGWKAQEDGAGAVVLKRTSQDGDESARASARPEAVRLELFTNRLRAIAAEMGEMLRRTALSTNVKERMDFSCALLDADGRLVVNAPHIPVHLGAMGVCVRRVREALEIRPGDCIVTNHPAFGGSHLPDVTVLMGVFDDDALLGYVAARAHHAEIGGVTPGSMPPMAKRLAEEGVVINPMRLIDGGTSRFDELRKLLTSATHPSRSPEENIADVGAAVAACRRGAESLRAMARAHGVDALHDSMGKLARQAESQLRDALRRLGDGVHEAEERMDDGSPVRVRIEIADGAATIDFAGSSPVHPGNLNATEAIVRSAVIYALRLLVREDLPLNEGLMNAASVRIPTGMLNPDFDEDPEKAPAVAGGNVETSQRIVDVLLKALKLAAGSQGTMNNVLFGNERYGHYETICGGAGAGPDFNGASAVQTHMTNTRITDAELLERRYPVRVERFAIRSGSGGAGRHGGGDGAVREIVFLEPVTLSVLTQRRTERPYGMEGAEAGSAGRQRIVRASGEEVELASIDGCEMQAGDRLIIETPGGGGWGHDVRRRENAE